MTRFMNTLLFVVGRKNKKYLVVLVFVGKNRHLSIAFVCLLYDGTQGNYTTSRYKQTRTPELHILVVPEETTSKKKWVLREVVDRRVADSYSRNEK